ncbi:hypothetical protein JB92DRAFT_3115255 [Gautieria morchelliformis]|nr:hypothetical protein JB92DRAFT_3115255 [Gautieria morchelliformis]
MSPLPKSNTFPSKSKVQPCPNFAAGETREPDVTHDLETLDIGTASQTSKSKKKKSVAVDASMASKKGVSGVKRKKLVEDDGGPGPSKHYKMLESIPVPAKGKEKITKAAKGAPNKILSSTAAGSSGPRHQRMMDVLGPTWWFITGPIISSAQPSFDGVPMIGLSLLVYFLHLGIPVSPFAIPPPPSLGVAPHFDHSSPMSSPFSLRCIRRTTIRCLHHSPAGTPSNTIDTIYPA